MTVLVIAEHQNNQLIPTTLNTISAAKQLGDVHVLIAGDEIDQLIEYVKKIENVKEVLVVKAPYYQEGLAEEIAPLVVSIAEQYDYIVTTASAYGKNILPRVSALLNIPQISDVIEIIDQNTFTHPIYAGNAIETVRIEGKATLTIRATAFDVVTLTGNAIVKEIEATAQQNLTQFISREIHKSDRPELTQANIIISGGRGLGSKEQFDSVLTPLADELKAAIGASRAAVDAGYAPNDLQVGQTGKVVAPELYIAIGISGAIQHLAGMQDSKVIVAINKDADAPIFNIADYGLVADLFTAVPEFVNELKKQ